MKYEYYTQMPTPPATGIGDTGTDTFTISPSSTIGNITRIKSVYIDLPAQVALNINLSVLSGQSDIVSNGNEAGSIVFRSGVMLDTPITVTVTGPMGTAYGVKLITEIEVPESQNVSITNFPTIQDVRVTNPTPTAQAGVPGWLALGLAVGFIYMAIKKSEPIKM